jgi:hypothetical protein
MGPGIKLTDNSRRIFIAAFQLIKEDYYKIDVFVETSKEAEDIWRKYKSVTAIKNTLDLKSLITGVLGSQCQGGLVL